MRILWWASLETKESLRKPLTILIGTSLIIIWKDVGSNICMIYNLLVPVHCSRICFRLSCTKYPCSLSILYTTSFKCTLHTGNCTLYTAHSILHTDKLILNTIYCILHPENSIFHIILKSIKIHEMFWGLIEFYQELKVLFNIF